jgi:hypothetical protein
MPNPIDRPSLKVSLSQRYATQHVGGAFDDRNIPTVAGTRGAAGGLGFGLQETQFTIPLFRIGAWAFLQQSDFINEGNDLSIYVQGLDTTPYKK